MLLFQVHSCEASLLQRSGAGTMFVCIGGLSWFNAYVTLYFPAFSEASLELEKVGHDFSVLPCAFVGALMNKFMGGALGAKGWPAGTVKVAELCGEYFFLGLESIARCCMYRGCLKHGCMAEHIKTELQMQFDLLMAHFQKITHFIQ